MAFLANTPSNYRVFAISVKVCSEKTPNLTQTKESEPSVQLGVA